MYRPRVALRAAFAQACGSICPYSNADQSPTEGYTLAMQATEFILSASWVLPIAPDNTSPARSRGGGSRGRIVGLAPIKFDYSNSPNCEHTHLEHHILLPGLVNAHGHGAMSLMRGVGAGLPLQEWLNEAIWPFEARIHGRQQ